MKIENLRTVSNLYDDLAKQKNLLKWIDDQRNKLLKLAKSSAENDIENFNNMDLGLKLFYSRHPTPTWEREFRVDNEILLDLFDILEKKTLNRKDTLETKIKGFGVDL